MKADAGQDWALVEDAAMLQSLTGAQPLHPWVAVAVPSAGPVQAVLSAVWMPDGRVFAFIDIKRPILPMTLCRAVAAFHGCLREAGATEIHGVRADHAAPRWMEWLGAEKTDETIDGMEVWAWRS